MPGNGRGHPAYEIKMPVAGGSIRWKGGKSFNKFSATIALPSCGEESAISGRDAGKIISQQRGIISLI